MAVIEREYKPEMVQLRLKLEKSLKDKLEQYAAFMQSSVDHIVVQAIQYVIDRDKDFRAAHDAHLVKVIKPKAAAG